jgi:hypothetical protein
VEQNGLLVEGEGTKTGENSKNRNVKNEEKTKAGIFFLETKKKPCTVLTNTVHL